jgi:hypothetical protein
VALSRRRKAAYLGAAGSALALAWIVAPAGVPIYDGIGNPDDPYRYVSPPPSAVTDKAPSSVTGHSPVVNGFNKDLLFLTTREMGPQITVSIPQKSLRADSATQVTVHAEPEAPAGQPSGATIDGNVARLTFAADKGSVTTGKNISFAYVVLRATSGRQPGPTMYYRTTGSWRALHTSRVGNDIYQSGIPGPGEYALAFAADAKSSSGSHTLVIVLVAVIVGVVVLLLAVRLLRRRA